MEELYTIARLVSGRVYSVNPPPNHRTSTFWWPKTFSHSPVSLGLSPVGVDEHTSVVCCQCQLKSTEPWKKTWLFRVYRGWKTTKLNRDYNKLKPLYYKDPYQPTSIMERTIDQLLVQSNTDHYQLHQLLCSCCTFKKGWFMNCLNL